MGRLAEPRACQCRQHLGAEPQAPSRHVPELAGAIGELEQLLAAQAEVEQLVLLTADPQLAAFPCMGLW